MDRIDVSSYYQPAKHITMPERPNFDIPGAEKILRIQARRIDDVRDGEGFRLSNTEPAFQLDIHEGIYLARYKDPLLDITMNPAKSLVPSNEWVVLSGELRGMRAALSLSRQGFMSLNRVAEGAGDIPQIVPEKKEEQLTEVVGNVGRFTDLKIGPKTGRARFTFSIYEHIQDQPDRLHRVVMWLEAAEQAAQEIGAGDFVRVGGKLNTRQTQDRQGQPRTVVELVGQQWQILRKARPQNSR